MNSGSKVFVTDCEGPVSKNDNAFELMSHLVPGGDRVFTLISRYDDVLADIVKKPGYKAGDTLRLILPFLKTYGATDERLRAYSSHNILLVAGADETLKFVNKTMRAFIVSTSYEHYVHALCDSVKFPKQNTYSTRLNIDKFRLTRKEKERLRAIAKEISAMPMFEIPDGAVSLRDLPQESLTTMNRLDEFFWNEISQMEACRMLKEVNPVGGFEKAKAIKEIVVKTGVDISDVLYVGDSITDVDPLQLIKDGGGLAVSFNGNGYAVREAEIAVMSHHTVVTSILAEVFNRHGKEAVLELADAWSSSKMQSLCSPSFVRELENLPPDKMPIVKRITADNEDRLMRESSLFRKTVRGEAIGRLG
jgi:energy-converting hydrogenase A subunit R